MFIAKDIDGNIVTIEEAELFEKENPNIKKEYFCPSCGERMEINSRESKNRRVHFRHKRGALCNDDWVYDMSEWHRNWQNCFPKEHQEVVMTNEKGETHRADVCINNIVIEFQHSPIKSEEIKKRNLFYVNLGYSVIWVFDANNKIMDLDNNMLNTDYPYSKLHMGINMLYWARKNSVFENFPYCNNPKNKARVEVLLETECNSTTILLYSQLNSGKCIDSYITASPVLKKNLLKTMGVLTDDKVATIGQLIKDTEKMLKNRHVYSSVPIYRHSVEFNMRSRLPKGKHRF